MSATSSLVATGWLAEHLDDDDLRVVDASWFLPGAPQTGSEAHEAGHIPGAVFFDIDAVADRATDLPHMLPHPEAFAEAVGAMGITERHRIVCYDAAGIFSAARAWWTFRTMGAARVSVLDGGLPKWRAEGRPVSTNPPRHPAATFTAHVDAHAVADLEAVRAAAGTGVQVVDARSPSRFRGEEAEPRAGVRAGHIPASRNVHYDRLLADGEMIAPEAIGAVFRDAGVETDAPTIVSCGSGVTAAILALALDRIGAPRPQLYDGSWAEWGAHPDTDVATMTES